MGLLLLLRQSRHLSPLLRRLLPPLVITAVLVALGMAALKVEPLRIRLLSMVAGREDSSNNFRINVWLSALEMVRDHPWLGIGPGNSAFNLIYPLYQQPRFTALSAYSVPLELAVETGIPGLLAGLGLWITSLRIGLGQLQRVAERIREAIGRPVELADGVSYNQLSASAGVVMSERENTAEELIQRADRLMYHSKQRGKDRVSAEDRSQDMVALRAAALVPELGRAVEHDEFIVHFQPIVDLRTGAPVAAEALLRWQHPRWGLLGPEEFLCAAETSPHMPEIGGRVLHLACHHAQQWTGAMADSAVHVNISGRQLEVGDLHADVLDALAKTALPPDRLVLELTETHAGRAEDSAKTDLERLRRLGVRIAIDDVGTGFSGLVRILDLPIDILKIDKQFVHGLPDDARCEAIVKAILSMATSLRLTVIAEGIEKRAQCDALVSWGCELGQGFLFGRAQAPVGPPPSPATAGA